MKWTILITCLTCSGCLFSGPDFEETPVTKGYYIVYEGQDHHLVRKENDASTSAVILASNIDSIGFNDKFILAVSRNTYYLIDVSQKVANSTKIYKSYTEINEIYQHEKIVLKKVK